MTKYEPIIVIQGDSCTVVVEHGDFGWQQTVQGLTPEQSTLVKQMLLAAHSYGKRAQMEAACSALSDMSIALHKSR